ncbi:hypothetical protein R9C00_00560 [Flammeovirgaceae bacterium SG7u.111]|nr:hypothetical protein [Flammeovirgaceae bacterium SG7u.132]WPO35941.1 hypothetical protein R9C00_00560 [Flammeovirgaceae bacterium SG7u.111]
MTDEVQVDSAQKTNVDFIFEPVASKKQDRMITAAIIIGALLLVTLVIFNF